MYAVSDLFKTYISQPGREFEAKVVRGTTTYDKAAIVEFDIVESIVSSDELVLGAVVASKLNLQLRTADAILANDKLQPFVRLNGSSGWTEWVPLGSFYVDVPKYQNSVWQISANDKLIYANKLYVPSVTIPCTMQEIMEDICGQLGLSLDVSSVINPWWMMSRAPDPSYTMRDMLGFSASTMGACVRMTKDEKLGFVVMAPPTYRTSISSSNIFKIQQTNPVKTYSGIIATYTADGKTISAGTIADLDKVINLNNPLMIQTILDSVLPIISGFSYAPFSMEWKGNPMLEPGDAVAVLLRDGTTINSTILSQTSTYKGGLKVTSSAPSYSPQRSESDYKGTMQPTIDRSLSAYAGNVIAATFTTDGLGLTITKDGEDEVWTLVKNTDGKIISMASASGRTITVTY